MAASNDSSATGNSVPALIPASGAASDAEAFGPVIELEAVDSAAAGETVEEPIEEEAAAPAHGWRLPTYAPLAAGLALAVIAGALAGAAANAVLTGPTSSAPVVAGSTHALQTSVAQLGSELAALKAGVATVQRSSSTQLGKIAERLDRAEKAQAEPAGKLAKLQESLDRLEHRQQVAAAPAAAASADASDITGSIKLKEDSKQAVVEGWRLRDYFDNHAIIEGKNGTLFRVGQGSVIPGLGKVEAIKRENGKVVVVTGSGIIAAALEQPRRPSYYPRW